MTPPWVLAWDALHVLYLGVMLSCCKLLVWDVIFSGAISNVGTLDERISNAVIWIDNDIDAWYKQRARNTELKQLTRITAFTAKRVGTPDERTLRTKGDETYGF